MIATILEWMKMAIPEKVIIISNYASSARMSIAILYLVIVKNVFRYLPIVTSLFLWNVFSKRNAKFFILQNKKTHYNRKKGKRKLNSFSSQGSSSSKANSSLLGSQEFHEMDSGIGSSQEVGSTASSLDPLLNRQISSENTESDNIDSFVRSKNTKVVETIPERLSPLTILSRKLKKNGNVPKTSIGECDTNDATCLVCTTNRKNGIFVHGKYSHICCCYSCSKKVWTKNGRRCPICNRKVTQVLKAFYVWQNTQSLKKNGETNFKFVKLLFM